MSSRRRRSDAGAGRQRRGTGGRDGSGAGRRGGTAAPKGDRTPSTDGRSARRGAAPESDRTTKADPSPSAERSDQVARTFRLGVIPGAMPGKWISAWRSRMPHVPIELVPIDVAAQRTHLDVGESRVDAAIVRLPVERAEDLHVIPLYEEVPVVVAPVDSFLMAADELTADDLIGQVLITPSDDVLGALGLPTIDSDFPPLPTTADAVATVAAGIGILVVPMSLARLHHRGDVAHRPLLGVRSAPVGLTWPRAATTPDVETFVGIVRGRTPNSSR